MELPQQTAGILAANLECRLVDKAAMTADQAHFAGWWSPPSPGTVLSAMRQGATITTMRAPDGRETEARWTEGTVICLQPAAPRRHEIVSGASVTFSYVRISFVAFEGLDLLSFYQLPMLYEGTAAASIAGAIEETLALGLIEDPLTRAISEKALCLQILRLMLRGATLKSESLRRIHGLQRVSAALSQLTANFADELNIAQLAEIANLSPSRFQAVFKEMTGMTPFDTVKRCRLEAAARLLASSDMTVSEIGEAVGWHDPFHFSRTFKKSLGVSPKHYREQVSLGLRML